MDSDEEPISQTAIPMLDDCLNRAQSHMPVTRPEQILEFLPDCNRSTQQFVAGELLKLDMQACAALGLLRSLEFYQPLLAGLFDDGRVPLDIVLEELEVRREFDEEYDLPQLQQRFPHLAEILVDLLSNSTVDGPASLRTKCAQLCAGDVVDEFVILRHLGQGSFADVYLARQTSMLRLVALKVSLRESDEPIALSQLDHPNIVRVFDQRRCEMPAAHLLYMEYVAGGTLADIVRGTCDTSIGVLSGRQLMDSVDQALFQAEQQTPTRSPTRQQLVQLEWPATVAWIGVQLAEALAHAAEQGVLHRDVKPANILISAECVPKLADFNVGYGSLAGCAAAADHFGGSLVYMSPEQLQAADSSSQGTPGELDARSDLYSLAIVLWEMWQGQRPFQTVEKPLDWQRQVRHQIELRATTLELARPAHSAAGRVLEKSLRRGLENDRGLRPQTGKEFAARLRLALHPAAAELFEPAQDSWRARLLKLPVGLALAPVVFVPNALAGVLNYQYNHHSLTLVHPELLPLLVRLSIWLNCISFSLGGILFLSIVQPVQRGIQRAAQGLPAQPPELEASWSLGHRCAILGGLLWTVAGIGFVAVLGSAQPSFGVRASLEFFFSLAICGGIAWIYPFFGVSLLTMLAYVPATVAPTMVDAHLPDRTRRLKHRATHYLASAAAIPLFALGLLALTPRSTPAHSSFLLTVVILAGIALPFAFMAHQRLLLQCDCLESVLGEEENLGP